MSSNKEILESIRQLNVSLSNTIKDCEKSNRIEFYKESIKLSALQIFEKAQLLSDLTPQSNVLIEPEKKNNPVVKKEPVQEMERTESLPEKVAVIPVVESKIETKTVTEPVKKETIIHQPVQQKSNIVSDAEEDFSLNAKIAKFQTPIINVADKMKDTPIKELVKAISISKKFEFINDLFGGNPELYKSCLQTIETSESLEAANSFIENNIAGVYGWDDKELLATEFFALIKRRFL